MITVARAVGWRPGTWGRAALRADPARLPVLSLFSPLPFREDIWFDDVDPADIEAAIGPEAARIARKRLGQSESTITLVKERAFSGYAGHVGQGPGGRGRGSSGRARFPLLPLSWAGASRRPADTRPCHITEQWCQFLGPASGLNWSLRSPPA